LSAPASDTVDIFGEADESGGGLQSPDVTRHLEDDQAQEGRPNDLSQFSAALTNYVSTFSKEDMDFQRQVKRLCRETDRLKRTIDELTEKTALSDNSLMTPSTAEVVAIME
jgi:hypothetical protein